MSVVWDLLKTQYAQAPGFRFKKAQPPAGGDTMKYHVVVRTTFEYQTEVEASSEESAVTLAKMDAIFDLNKIVDQRTEVELADDSNRQSHRVE